jgi:hypothetical protein
MSNVTVEQEFEALMNAFSEELDEIGRDIRASGGRSYQVEGAHVRVGRAEPLSDEYFRNHGLSRIGGTGPTL